MIGRRLVQIGWAGGGLALLAFREYVAKVPPSDSKVPQRLRDALDRLGPTFIKLGQALSLRHDVLPDAYLLALRGLQEHAKPFASELVRKEIERELGRPIEAVFSTFELEPLAAASIAQVHSARLRDGTQVVVKVRRPDIRVCIDRDMRTLIRMIRVMETLVPGLARCQPVRLAEEIWVNLRRETDFRQEARSNRRFVTVFKERTDIYIPPVIEDLCRDGVMVQVMSHGKSIDDPTLRPDGPRLAEVLVDFYLQQFFVTGLFHGDPHPGNLFVMEDGRLCFHDFGLVGFLDGQTRRNLAVFVQAFIVQDASWMLDAAIDLKLIAAFPDRAPLTRGLEELLADYVALPLKDWSVAEVFLRVARLSGGNVMIPYQLVVLTRALFLVECAIRTLDPQFNVLEKLIAKGDAAMRSLTQLHPQATAIARLKVEGALTAQDLPALIAVWLHRVQQGANVRCSA
ncbi:MAG: ABC1 kinase family protein [Pigmentiphaga sp.]